MSVLSLNKENVEPPSTGGKRRAVFKNPKKLQALLSSGRVQTREPLSAKKGDSKKYREREGLHPRGHSSSSSATTSRSSSKTRGSTKSLRSFGKPPIFAETMRVAANSNEHFKLPKGACSDLPTDDKNLQELDKFQAQESSSSFYTPAAHKRSTASYFEQTPVVSTTTAAKACLTAPQTKTAPALAATDFALFKQPLTPALLTSKGTESSRYVSEPKTVTDGSSTRLGRESRLAKLHQQQQQQSFTGATSAFVTGGTSTNSTAATRVSSSSTSSSSSHSSTIDWQTPLGSPLATQKSQRSSLLGRAEESSASIPEIELSLEELPDDSYKQQGGRVSPPSYDGSIFTPKKSPFKAAITPKAMPHLNSLVKTAFGSTASTSTTSSSTSSQTRSAQRNLQKSFQNAKNSSVLESPGGETRQPFSLTAAAADTFSPPLAADQVANAGDSGSASSSSRRSSESSESPTASSFDSSSSSFVSPRSQRLPAESSAAAVAVVTPPKNSGRSHSSSSARRRAASSSVSSWSGGSSDSPTDSSEAQSLGSDFKSEPDTATTTPPSPSVEEESLVVKNGALVRVGKRSFRLVNKLGVGGSAQVWSVEEVSKKRGSGTLYALKIVQGLNKKTLDSYRQEIGLLLRLKNKPSVCKLYCYQETRDSLLLVLEYGESNLEEYLRKLATLYSSFMYSSVVNGLWAQILAALASVHEEKIAHLDLKPANLMLCGGFIKLIDFGISKTVEEENDGNTFFLMDCRVGTVNYISPEALSNPVQVKGRSHWKVRRKSDIWSLGCIYYRMVYGKPPFAHLRDQMAKMLAICNPSHEIDFPKRNAVGQVVPEAVITTMRKCLSWKAEDRPSVKELLQLL